MPHTKHTAPIEYREISRYVGYRFGSDGSFWSCRDSQGRLTDRWTQRDGCIGQRGYVVVDPKDADLGRRKVVRLHKLILEAFKGPCPPGLEARHFPDRNPTNNRVENLDWSTHAVNMADKKEHGTISAGSKHGRHKLTDEQVAEIRERFAAGAMSQELACIYGVCHETITKIAYGDRWKDLPGCPPVARPKVKRSASKLTHQKVDEIQRLRATGMIYAEIAARFGVTVSHVGYICRGKRWAD